MLGINPIKAIAFATALTTATVCAAQNRPQNSQSPSKNIVKEFRKADVNPCDSFVSQAELNTYMGNSKTNIKKFDVTKDKLLDINEFAPIVNIKKTKQQIKRLHPEYVDFVPAKTMKEAVKFAKEQFGTTLKLENNLVAANFVNQLLTNLNNKMKGTGVLPREVVFDRRLISQDGLEGYAAWNSTFKQFIFGPAYIKEFETAQKIGLSFDEVLQSYMRGKRNNAVYRIKAIYHELGHANHYEHCKNASKMGRLEELRARSITDNSFTLAFLKDVMASDVVKNYFKNDIYPLSSPAEFVADVFAYKIMGKEIPDEVDRLYDKYGGMPVPE